MKILITGMLGLFFLSSCAQSSPEDKMKATAKKLLGYLASDDTLAFFKLYLDSHDSLKQNKEYPEAILGFYKDCKTYQKIISHHGKPDFTKIKLNPGYNNFTELELSILDNPDTTLKIKSCKIIITFYPATYDVFDKITRYSLLTYSDLPKRPNIIRAPDIILPQKN